MRFRLYPKENRDVVLEIFRTVHRDTSQPVNLVIDITDENNYTHPEVFVSQAETYVHRQKVANCYFTSSSDHWQWYTYLSYFSLGVLRTEIATELTVEQAQEYLQHLNSTDTSKKQRKFEWI